MNSRSLYAYRRRKFSNEKFFCNEAKIRIHKRFILKHLANDYHYSWQTLSQRYWTPKPECTSVINPQTSNCPSHQIGCICSLCKRTMILWFLPNVGNTLPYWKANWIILILRKRRNHPAPDYFLHKIKINF